MKTILITGAAGFIGSSLAEKLVDSHKIIGIDSFNDYYDPKIKRNNVESLNKHENFKIYEGDIRDKDLISKIFNDHDISCVIHLAARAGVRPSLEQPSLYMDVNITGTTNLLEATRLNDIKKFIFASSSSVYGALKKGPFHEEMDITKTKSQYAASKVAGEVICRTYSSLYDIQTICLRFFTVYGPRQRPDLAINKFANLIKQGKPIPVYGDGSTQRNYTYIDDIVDGITRCLSYDDEKFEVFNLGGDETVSLSDLIKVIEDKIGKKAIIDRQPEQPGDVPLTHADISKIRNALGYNPSTDIETGIENFVKSMK